MFLSVFNLLSSVDPQTQQLLNNLMEVLLPILYSLGGCGLVFATAKYALKIHSDPENKGEYIRHMVLKCFRLWFTFNVISHCSHYFRTNAWSLIIMKFMFLDTFGIGEAIWDLLYNIFLKGPLYIVHGLGDAITYLSGQKIVDLIFGSNGHFLNMPPQFFIFLSIAIMLVVLFAGGVILRAMVNQNIGSAISGIANRIIMVVLLMVLIPLFFGSLILQSFP
ncbi:hypothetical protein [Spiroplasma endosymbiont of Nebria brevicollis]|uniref:hypothetical protein n=1 Tax=Spiroplasma endosymbiont of Nebria brevicollis TaxID=3066284 RepID=UPI00313EDA81